MAEPEANRLNKNDNAVINAIFNPFSPIAESDESSEVNIDPDHQLDSLPTEAKNNEVEGVNDAEAGNFDAALHKFNQCIREVPTYASVYNNRAQVHRLMGNTPGALRDLDEAIRLSGGRGKAAMQAYTQRGLIRKLENEEEAAKLDFQLAADLGSQFARHILVQMNPYAAMCNKMLSEVIHKLRAGQVDSDTG